MVVVSARTKLKTELQLASVGSLTSKTSSEAFFLHFLKVILRLRDASRLAAVKAKGKQVETTIPAPSHTDGSSASGVGASAPSTAGAPSIEAPAKPMEVVLQK